MKKIHSIQEWLPFEKVLSHGIVKINSNTYIKILKIHPINYQLKTDLEKQSILNSYKIFLKTCNFDMQILIQNIPENLSKIFQYTKQEVNKQNEIWIQSILDQYIQYLKELSQKRKLVNKNFYLIIKNSFISNNSEQIQSMIEEELNDKFYKIKECLNRCGNSTTEIIKKEEILWIFKTFFGLQNS